MELLSSSVPGLVFSILRSPVQQRASSTVSDSAVNLVFPLSAGISPTVKKTEMDKSPFNSPSPQDNSPRLSSFTQHHRPVIAVHSGKTRAEEPLLILDLPQDPV